MKFCGNCGTQLDDDVCFCPNCGTRIDFMPDNSGSAETASEMQNQNYGNPNGYPGMNMPPQPKKPVNKKKLGIIIGAVVAVLLVFVIVFAIVRNVKRTINVNEYISVEFTGYDTVGQAEVKFDVDGFDAAVMKAQGKKIKNNPDDYTWNDLVDLMSWEDYALADSIETELDKSENLSNGDKVTVTITYDESAAKDAGVKLKVSEQSFTVDGLGKLQDVDPFEKLEVSYEGVAPSVSVVWENNASGDYLPYVNFEIEDAKDNYDLGDSFTLKVVDDYVENAKFYGYHFTETEKTYTIDAVDQYVTSIADLGEDDLAQLKKDAEKVINDECIADYADDVSVKGPKYVGEYLLNAKQEMWGSQNYLFIVYSATISSADNSFKKTTVYYPVRFEEVITKANGIISYESNDSVTGYSSLLDADGGYTWYSTYGYTDGEDMYNSIVVDNSDYYDYEVSEKLQKFGK